LRFRAVKHFGYKGEKGDAATNPPQGCILLPVSTNLNSVDNPISIDPKACSYIVSLRTTTVKHLR